MSLRSWFMAGAVGAGLAYFLDANKGRRRRNMTRDRLGAVMRRSATKADKTSRYVGGQVQGAVQETVHMAPRDNPNPDDRTLKDRVETELFRDAMIPKGDLNINVVERVVELRGELPKPEDINDVVERVRKVDDVRDVRNYLHLPNTVAPNKEPAVQPS